MLNKKIRNFFAFIGAIGIAGSVLIGIAYAAPTNIFQKSIFPEVTDRYDLGSSTPAFYWNGGYFKTICLEGDTCRTTWPAGGPGGGGAWPFTPSTSWGVAVQSTTTPLAINAVLASSTTALPALAGSSDSTGAAVSAVGNSSGKALEVKCTGTGPCFWGSQSGTSGYFFTGVMTGESVNPWDIAHNPANATAVTSFSWANNVTGVNTGPLFQLANNGSGKGVLESCWKTGDWCYRLQSQGYGMYISANGDGGSVDPFKVSSGTATSTLLELFSSGNLALGDFTTIAQRFVVGSTTGGNTVRVNGLSTSNNAPCTSLFRSGTADWTVCAGGSTASDFNISANPTYSGSAYTDATIGSASKFTIKSSNGQLTYTFASTTALSASSELFAAIASSTNLIAQYASTSIETIATKLYLPTAIGNYQLLETDGSGAVAATTSIGYNMITGTPAIPTGANPTASVGATSATNGSAATFMRSDAVPACTAATGSVPGCLSAVDWNKFNNQMSTTSPWTTGQVAFVNANGNVSSVATSAASCTSASGIACTGFNILGSGGTTFSLSAIPNTSLSNSSVIINTSGGLTGGGTVALGGTLNLASPGDSFTHPIPAQSATSTTLYFTSGIVALASSTIGYPSATTTILGPLMVGNTAQNGTMIGSTTMLQVSSSTNNFLQSVLWNTSTGSNASADMVFNNNLSTNNNYYGEVGINGGNYNQPLFAGQSNDMFLLVSDGSMNHYLASTTASDASSSINFYTKGTLASNLRFKITNSGYSMFGTSTAAWGLLTLATSTAPQLMLSDGVAANANWTLRAIAGSFFLASSTGISTSTSAAFSINPNGQPLFPTLGWNAGGCVQANSLGLLTTTGGSCSGLSGWTAIKGGIYNSTTTDQVMTGETSTTSIARFEAKAANAGLPAGYFNGLLTAGTTTPFWELTSASSSGPQLGLSDGVAANSSWTFRAIAGSLFFATSTATATSSVAAISIAPTSVVTFASSIVFNAFTWAGTTFNSFSSAFTSSSGVLSSVSQSSFTYSTSTAWTGTTTIMLEQVILADTYNALSCYSPVGTLNIQIGNGTASTTMLNASSTNNINVFSANNAMSVQNKVRVDIGTPASAPTTINCTVKKTI